MKFSQERKSFEMSTNCSSEPATPAHILECLGLTKQDLAACWFWTSWKCMISWTWSSTTDQWGVQQQQQNSRSLLCQEIGFHFPRCDKEHESTERDN
ncbi:hypothetical protein TNCV_3749441 [Trichonephila clavipes]|nr:hypothetical protein TNCV_3749441 [Trichonephila clavipes]